MAHKHDETELERVARVHVGYELEMLAGTSRPMVVSAADVLVGTAMFEACLVHARCVNEFLTRESGDRWPRRVSAIQYFEDTARWAPVPVLTKDENDAISRKIAHVFCDRESPELNWASTGDCTGIAKRLLAAMRSFQLQLESVHPNRARWFDDGLASARVALGEAVAGRVIVSRIPPGTVPAIPFWANGDQAT
jgi:hypothetical protein